MAAAVAAKEEESERRVSAALSDLEAESQRADEAERRAAAAERAKIELTLALAADEIRGGANRLETAFRSSLSHGESRGSENTTDSDLLRRAEEAELAAAVQVSV